MRKQIAQPGSYSAAQKSNLRFKLPLNEGQKILSAIQAEWDDFSSYLQQVDTEDLTELDLFSQIELLSNLDESQALLSSHIEDLKSIAAKLRELESIELSSEEQENVRRFEKEAGSLINHIVPKVEDSKDFLSDTIEDVITTCQWRITDIVDSIERRDQAESLEDQIEMRLDKETELKEIRDALETYREIRLETSENLAGNSLIEQLDSLILACDEALLIDEVGS